MEKNSLYNERDQYISAMAEIVIPLLNGEQDGSVAVANEFISRFAIKDVKAQACVRVMMFHMGLWGNMINAYNKEYINSLIGLDINILVDIAMDEWEDLSERLK